jgi:hypothetical protein
LAAKLSLPLAYLNRELLLIDILDLNARARISAYANAVPSREISQNLVLALAGLRSLPDSPKLVSLALDRMLQGRFNSRQVRALINWTKAGNDPGEFAVAPVKEPKISPPAVAPRRPSGARGLWRGSPLATNPKFSSGRKLLHLASKAWSLARPALWWFAKQIMDFKPLKDGLKVSIAVTVFMVVVLGKQWFGSTLKSFLPSANVAMPNEAVRTPGSDGESLSAAKGLTRRRGEAPRPNQTGPRH